MKVQVAIGLLLIAATHAFPGGAPSIACETLIPLHGVEPLNETSPYVIDASRTPIAPGSRSYAITIKSVVSSTPLAGYILQARNPANISSYITYGSFEPIGPFDEDKQAVTCLNPNDTSTHTNRNPKGQLILKWVAPSSGSGQVIFVGTVVQSYTRIFANLTSAIISYGS